MKRRIFWRMVLVSMIAVSIAGGAILGVFYYFLGQRTQNDLRNELVIVASAMDAAQDDKAYLNTLEVNGSLRITYVATNGTVLYDSMSDASGMENHAGREEISEALQYGRGHSERVSPTLGEQTVYYASRLQNGNVVRVSVETKTVLGMVLQILPVYLLAALVSVMISAAIARRLTGSIVAPINEINLDDPVSGDSYEEIAPLLTRIDEQNRRIDAQVQEIRAQQKEFQAITEHMSEGLVVLGADCRILSINRSAVNLFGVQDADVTGQPFVSLNRSLEVQKALDGAYAGTTESVNINIGDKVHQVIVSPVYREGVDVPGGAVVIAMDVTERVRAEQMRREFTSNVSHELKTPLTSISGYAEIMKSGMVKPEDLSEFAGRIMDEAGRLIALVEDIIELTRLDEDAGSAPKTNVDVYALAQEIMKRLALSAEKKNVHMVLNGQKQEVTGYRKELGEILFNLADNAIKYNRENGTCTVDISGDDHETVIAVSDTGIGIAAGEQEKVFQRFYRVDKSRSRETGGTGLGLSIVKHAALRHNAQIKVDSRPGNGTRITVRIPRAQ